MTDGKNVVLKAKGGEIVKDRTHAQGLWLTKDEALGLLDIVLMSPVELTSERRDAVLKLSEFCREYLRDDEEKPARRRRGRRGGRGRARPRPAGALEATFDHGEEGYGLWLDPAVQDDPIYAEYWAGHRPVEVAIEEDQIVIRRAGGDADTEDGDVDGDGDAA